MTTKGIYVQGVGQVVEESRDFYSNLLSLAERNARLITSAQEMKTRIVTAGEGDIGKSRGTWKQLVFNMQKNNYPY